MAQVGVFERALVARCHLSPASCRSARRGARSARRRRGRSRRWRRCRSARATNRGRTAAAARHAQPGACEQRRQPRGTAPASAPTLPSGPVEHRQRLVLDIAEVGVEDLAVAVDQAFAGRRRPATARPAGARPAAPPAGRARRGAARADAPTARPRTRRARAARSMLRDVAGQPRRGVRADRADAVALQFAFELDHADRQPRRTRQPQCQRGEQRERRAARSSAFAAAFISRMSAGSSVAACRVAIGFQPAARRAPSSVAAASSCRHSCS